MSPHRRRCLLLITAVIWVATALVQASSAVAQTHEPSEARAIAQTQQKDQEKGKPEEKKDQQKGKTQETSAPQAGSILLGVGVGVLLVAVGILAYGRIGLGTATRDNGNFVGVVRRVVLTPAGFFSGLPRQGNLANPLLFALICIEISTILSWLLVLVGVVNSPSLNTNPQALGLPSIFTSSLPVVSILTAPVAGLIGILIAAGIQQLLVRLIVGARNSGFGATLKVASYTQATNLVNWIPVIGPLLALYGIYLAVMGIREVHGTTMGKAALVVLLPFAVLLLVAVVILLAVGVAFFTQR